MLLQRLLFFGLICGFNFSFGFTLKNLDYQLPKNVKPIRYNLTMIPNFITDTFSGTVSIEIKALENSNHITLHALKLSMPLKEDIIVEELETGNILPVKSAEYSNSKYQYYKVTLFENLTKDTTYVITIPNFGNKFGKNRSGFSSGTYIESDGSKHYFAYTQFQPTDARLAFPCFDEPALRAKFNIRLVRPSEQFISASNGRLISQSESTPFIDTYEETVDMPTYLVAFTISEMRFSETLDRYRIIARPEALNKNQHKYGLSLTVNIYNFMESYTRVPFTLPKLDQVAIPTYNGGMENWGLIVYGERSLLLMNENDKPDIVSLVGHEAAHQWFGNLIGFTWWEYIWLSEGLATYFQYVIPSQVEPNIDSRGGLLRSMQTLFQVDMRLDTRPLTENPQTPIEIAFVFDSLAYKKGGAVMHMLQTSLTTPVFQKGLQYYVEDMQFKLATPADLYRNLQKAIDENVNTLPSLRTVADFMYSWEHVKGFPVVDVHRTYGSNSNIVELKQTRYVQEPLGEDGHWIVPINFASSNNLSFENTDPEYWLTETQQTVSVPYLNKDNWIIANKKETGYYRVNYDETNWDLITQTLMQSHLDIHVLNRAQLIDDSLNLAKTGRLKNDIAMKLVAYIKYEKDPIPWLTYNWNMQKLQSMFYYSPTYNTFKEYNFNIMKTVYNLVGYEEKLNESNLQKDLRNIVVNLLCKIDHPDCVNKSLNKLKQWIKTKMDLSELKSYTLCGAIKSGSQRYFDYLFNVLKHTNYPINIIKGLSCTKNIKNLYKLLKLNDKIPLDEMIETVMVSGPEGLQAGVNYVAHNFATIEETKNLNRSSYYAYTNFEPTDARRAFPCFDEPALRAKFNIRLVRPNQKFISASNSRLLWQSNSSPFIDTYEETVDMPTYLVAFTITEMKFSETLDRYRIIARPEALNENHHKYGLNLTVSAFNFMETYTRVPFILPKIDQVAIPEFQNGGMENWGLIVYKKYKLATPADLYQNLQKAVDENPNIMPNLTVADFMYSWENFNGFPVVDVDRTYGSNSNIVKLKQTRYTADPVGEDGHWIIPINFASSNKLSFENTNPEYWMTKTQQTVTLLYLNDSNWLIANKKCTGYYRVNYDETNWDLITQALLENHLNIHVLNRAQLIDDSLNLAITGRLKMDITMKLVPYINNETDPIPWISYLRNMRKLQTLVYYSQNYNIFKLCYGEAHQNSRKARRIYQQRYPLRHIPSHPTFQEVDRRLRETGCFKPPKSDSGRLRRVRTPNTEDIILQAVDNDPHAQTSNEIKRREDMSDTQCDDVSNTKKKKKQNTVCSDTSSSEEDVEYDDSDDDYLSSPEEDETPDLTFENTKKVKKPDISGEKLADDPGITVFKSDDESELLVAETVVSIKDVLACQSLSGSSISIPKCS
ncbi:hypothetical protein RN001_006675 [Aquatica leii]|uniref:Aminopeptidase n=1 Tax=Aquatica leii TaxID=1421715 RepID=A0AAN7PLD2_9COLE|nr:hypothetical protein RN001_006675 [Aquatica leii]